MSYNILTPFCNTLDVRKSKLQNINIWYKHDNIDDIYLNHFI